jgi:hypothetical protein
VAAMNEYFKQGHAIKAPKTEEFFKKEDNGEDFYDCFYLPHLAVIKESSSSTKTRIVFDASRKSSNGVSLNDTLLTGPAMQSDIVDKLLNFRKHCRRCRKNVLTNSSK